MLCYVLEDINLKQLTSKIRKTKNIPTLCLLVKN